MMSVPQSLRFRALALYRGLYRKIDRVQDPPQRLYYLNMLKDVRSDC